MKCERPGKLFVNLPACLTVYSIQIPDIEMLQGLAYCFDRNFVNGIEQEYCMAL